MIDLFSAGEVFYLLISMQDEKEVFLISLEGNQLQRCL